jgi:biotin transport system substrate-specific component
MASTRAVTLADVAFPRTERLVDVVLVVASSILTGLAAQVAIPLPWSPVPVTGQTFAVLLSGALLGTRRAFLGQLLYLIEGAAGLPVFAGGLGGVAVLLGPTAGYLYAFPFAAALTGSLVERSWDRRFLTMFAAMLLGSVVIFALGLAWLSRFVPTSQLLATGLLPFIPGDLVKSALAALAFPTAWRLLERRDHRPRGGIVS